MLRLFTWFLIATLCISRVSAQGLNAFKEIRLDSIPSDRQLRGLSQALKDSSISVKIQSIDRLMNSPWEGKLPDTVVYALSQQIDTTKTNLSLAIFRALCSQDTFSENYLRLIAPLLKDTESVVRRSAADALGRQDKLSDAYLKLLIPLLKDTQSDVRSYAADALGRQEKLSDAILKLLVLLLKDTDRDVRIYAADALGRQEKLSDEYLKLLVPLLNDTDRDVRSTAALLWGRQEKLSDAILTLLVLLLKDTQSDVRSSAAYALGRQEKLSDAILKLLVPLLKDTDRDVRIYAADALGRQEKLSDAYLKLLVPLLKDTDRDVRSSAADALGRQKKLSDAILTLLVPLLKDAESYVRRSAASALGRQEKLSDAYLKLLVPLLKDTDRDVRSSAASALGGQEKLSDAYLRLLVPLLKDTQSDVRSSAASALGRQEKLSDAYLKLLVPLLKDTQSDVRSSAASALGRQEKLSDVYLKLLVTLLKDTESNVRSSAADALGRQEKLSDVYLKLLVTLLKDTESNVRSSAADALGRQKKLSDAILTLLVPLLKDTESNVRSTAAFLWGRQEKLSDVYLKLLVPLLKDTESYVRHSAADALGRQKKLSDAILTLIVPLLKDAESYVRRSAAEALGRQEKLSDAYLKLIAPLLKDTESYGRSFAWKILYDADSILWYYAFPYVANRALVSDEDKFKEDAFRYRVPLYEVSGGNDALICLLKWFCRPRAYPIKIFIQEAQFTLDLIRNHPVPLDSNLLFKAEVVKALPNLIEAAESDWSKEDLERLEWAFALANEMGSTDAEYIGSILNREKSKNWFNRFAWFIGIHLALWMILVFIYPYSPMVQTIFFWNLKVRKLGGFGYVSFLLTWVPFLRRRLFAPFKESLIADIYTDKWQEDEYFPDSKVYAKKLKQGLSLKVALSPLKGQNVLIGESGLGKSMFLRHLAIHSKQIVAYLPAARCTKGLIPAIQHKVHGAAADPAFLKKLIYVGAIDILIDGLNEISAAARTQLKLEVEQYFKGNILLTTQPMDWEPPVAAKQFILQPLEEKQVEAFLLSRYPFLEQSDLIPESAFKTHSQDYLKKVFDSNLDIVSLKNNRHILSNPMDLTLVAQLLARGENPSLLDLQEQQYQLMAEEYKLNNIQQKFPLKKFSEVVYNMRISDQDAIPAEDFTNAIKAMENWKMVVSRKVQDAEGKQLDTWYFRHDKIMDYFLVQEFMEEHAYMEKHLDDSRFRGVYFLLAYRLEYDDAMVLREKLIAYAAETKDHSVFDNFVLLLRGKKKPRKEVLKEFREKILDHIAIGEAEQAIQLIRKKTNGKHQEEAAMLENRNTKLEEEIRQGVISSENAKLERNKLNKDILALAGVI